MEIREKRIATTKSRLAQIVIGVGPLALLLDDFHDLIDILFPIDDLDAARLDDIVTRALVDPPEPRIRSAVRSLDFNPSFVAVQFR